MATTTEIRDWQKRHLISLLKVKRSLTEPTAVLDVELESMVASMEPEDVARCEKVLGVAAL